MTMLAQQPTETLVQMFYDACVCGSMESAARLANILSFRGGDAPDQVRAVFAANCSLSGRDNTKLPKVSS